ncbi:MAG: hypothetical protein IJ428_03960 [Clostridia bacterium]|nr:hypothetical protein [Clostridia bacterium]
MAKQKKKKAGKTAPSELTPQGAVKASLKAFNWRRALLIAVATIAAFSLYEALIAVESLRVGDIPIIMPIYFGIVTVLVCAIVFFNHGFSQKEVTPDMFTDDGDPDRIKAACDNINRHKAIAKKLMLILLPFLFAIFFDIIYLFYGDFFKGAMEFIFGG